jgi:hypothetical protein
MRGQRPTRKPVQLTRRRIYILPTGQGYAFATLLFVLFLWMRQTKLLGEISVPAVPSANATNSTSPYDLVVGFAIPSGQYIHVSQHTAQTANQNWCATVYGGDY